MIKGGLEEKSQNTFVGVGSRIGDWKIIIQLHILNPQSSRKLP